MLGDECSELMSMICNVRDLRVGESSEHVFCSMMCDAIFSPVKALAVPARATAVTTASRVMILFVLESILLCGQLLPWRLYSIRQLLPRLNVEGQS